MSSGGAPLAELLDFGLCCPRCKGDLIDQTTGGDGALSCASCSERYPVLHGIPDLRVAPDPYIGMDADRAKGQRLASEGATSWQQLAARYYEITLDTVPPAQARRFEAGLLAAQPRSAAALDEWERLAQAAVDSTQSVLDVGCGTAPLLAEIGTRQPARTGALVGVDVAFRWLIVGQQRLADAGVRAHLVCACAEALPFRDARFGIITSQATLENVRGQDDAVREMHRTLRPAGRVWVSTANRLTPAPDPHLGIPAGGLVPDAIMAAVARRRQALPPVRQLLSRRTLSALLRRSQFSEVRFDVPSIPLAQRALAGPLLRVAAQLYDVARAVPPLRSALTMVGPTIIATAVADSRRIRRE